jgi:coatomer subunit beta'
LNYGMERAWSLAATKEANKLAIGYDEGCIVIELGSDDPVASMDSTGKIVWCKNNEVQAASVKGLAGANGDDVDGESLALVPRDLGNTEIYPQMLKHNCNGRFVAVCGDGEFIIYTSQTLRNKAFGQALDFVWSGSGTGDYAIRESISRIQVFNNFKESATIRPAVASAEGLYGGQLLGVKGGDSAVLFYDWDSGTFVRKIDVCPKDVYWSEAGNLVLLACADSAYVLTYDAAKVSKALAMGQVSPEDGIDGSFELLYEINESITSGKWVGDCFLFCNTTGKLNYSVGGQIQNLQHLETGSSGSTKHSILGYLAKEDRVYLIDKALNVTSYKIMLAVLQYQTTVMRGDFDTANELLPLIPESEYTGVAKFLESQDFKEEAMAVTTDPDHKFDLSLELNLIEAAHELLLSTPEEDKDSTDTMTKWKRLSDAAMKESNFDICEAASIASDDFSGLLLLYSSIGNLEGMERLCDLAAKGKKTNVAFVANLLLGRVESCYDLLVATKRLPEAAFFARTYLPSKLPEVIALWKSDLSTVSEAASKSLAGPSSNPEMFPDYDVALQVEQMFLMQREASKSTGIPAVDYLTAKKDLDLDLIALIKERQGGDAPPPAPAPVEEAKEEPAPELMPAPVPVPDESVAVQPEPIVEAAPVAAAPEEADDFGDDW